MSAILASMQQYNGTSQGWFMRTSPNPDTWVMPLMNTTAMVEALSIYARLWNASGSSSATECVAPGVIDSAFADGQVKTAGNSAGYFFATCTDV